MFASYIFKMKRGAVQEVIPGYIGGLNGRIPDCKLVLHACFDEIQKKHDSWSLYQADWCKQ